MCILWFLGFYIKQNTLSFASRSWLTPGLTLLIAPRLLFITFSGTYSQVSFVQVLCLLIKSIFRLRSSFLSSVSSLLLVIKVLLFYISLPLLKVCIWVIDHCTQFLILANKVKLTRLNIKYLQFILSAMKHFKINPLPLFFSSYDWAFCYYC